jgi:hypothetical protein
VGVGPRPGKVTDGPFASFSGVGYVDAGGKVRARLSIFGRTALVTLDRSQFAFDEEPAPPVSR